MLVIVRYSVTVKPNLFTPQSWASDPVLARSALSQSPALWLMRIRHASLTVLVADVQGQALGWSGEGPFLGSRLLAMSSRGRRGNGAPWGLLHEVANPARGGPTLLSSSLPGGPAP